MQNLLDSTNFQVFLFQLALVETFKSEVRKVFWEDVKTRNIPHLNTRFLKGAIIEQYQSPSAQKLSLSIYVDYASESVIVTLPGTSNLEQVKKYVTVREKYIPWAPSLKGQRGFLKLYQTIRDPLKNSLLRVVNDYSGYKIIFNGWSLGGSLCRLAVFDFLSDPKLYEPYFKSLWQEKTANERMYLITWGSPKCLTKASADEYTKRFIDAGFLVDYRFETTGDPIVKLPPLWTGFKATGTRFEVSDKLMVESGGFLGFARHFGYSQNTFYMFDYYEKMAKL